MKFMRKRKAVKKEDLLKYCKTNDVFAPKGAKVEYLESDIYRKLMDGKKPEIKQESCYGHFENEDMSCMVCDFKDECFGLSMGMPKEQYEEELAIHHVDNI